MYELPLSGKLRQFLVATVLNLATISFGTSCGWSSPVIPQLLSSDPPIGDAPMSEDEVSWIGALLPIGALIITPFCGILVERIGRKKFAFLTGLPHIVSWLLTVLGPTHAYLYAARLAMGIGGGMTFFIVPLYVSEIASEDIRGVLGSLLSLCANFGILFAFVAGAFLPYHLFSSLCLVYPTVFLAVILLMPEAPVYLVRRNRHVQAHKSLMFLRGNDRTLVEQELSSLQQQATDNGTSKSVGIRDFFKDKATRKGLIISFGLLGGQQLSGIFAMISYAETIFQRAGSSISSETAPMIIAAIQLIGAYASTMLMDRAGRRLLTLISCMGMAISHALVGLFFYLQVNQHDVSSISWLPLAALSTYMVTYVLGIGGVPFVVVSEIFRSDVSSFATTLSFIFFWAMSFAAIKIFGFGMDSFGADGCFFMLASICAISFAFTYFMLPETKGRKREDIIDELAGVTRNSEGKNEAGDKDNGDVKSVPWWYGTI